MSLSDKRENADENPTIPIDSTKDDLSDNDADQDEKEDTQEYYRDVFDFFDWNNSNTIPTSVSKCHTHPPAPL